MNLEQARALLYREACDPVQLVQVVQRQCKDKAEWDLGLAQTLDFLAHLLEGAWVRAHVVVRFGNAVEADGDQLRALLEHLDVSVRQQHPIGRHAGDEAERTGETQQRRQTGKEQRLAAGHA